MGVRLAVSDLDLLVLALKAMGYQHAQRQGNVVLFGDGIQSFNKDTGEVRVTSQETVAKVKQSYASQVMLSQAKKYGWTVTKTGENKYQLVKRV